MVEALTADLVSLVKAFIATHGEPLLVAAGCSIGIWFGFGWLLGPTLRLPGLRWLEPFFLAVRPLLSFGICWSLFYKLHADGVLNLGAGPASWQRAMLWSFLGSAGAMGINWAIQKYAPAADNEKARQLTDAAVETTTQALKSVAGKIAGGPPPPNEPGP